jgi:hypothetical protein
LTPESFPPFKNSSMSNSSLFASSTSPSEVCLGASKVDLDLL